MSIANLLNCERSALSKWTGDDILFRVEALVDRDSDRYMSQFVVKRQVEEKEGEY